MLLQVPVKPYFFIKLCFTGTEFWTQPVSIRPQQTPGSFITIKEGAGAETYTWKIPCISTQNTITS